MPEPNQQKTNNPTQNNRIKPIQCVAHLEEAEYKSLSESLLIPAVRLELSKITDTKTILQSAKENKPDVLILHSSQEKLTTLIPSLHKILPELFILVIEDETSESNLNAIDWKTEYLPASDTKKFHSRLSMIQTFKQKTAGYDELEKAFQDKNNTLSALMSTYPIPVAYLQDGLHISSNTQYRKVLLDSPDSAIEEVCFLDLFDDKTSNHLKDILQKPIKIGDTISSTFCSASQKVKGKLSIHQLDTNQQVMLHLDNAVAAIKETDIDKTEEKRAEEKIKDSTKKKEAVTAPPLATEEPTKEKAIKDSSKEKEAATAANIATEEPKKQKEAKPTSTEKTTSNKAAPTEAAKPTSEKQTIIDALKLNFQNNGFLLLFQPIVSLKEENCKEHYEVFTRVPLSNGKELTPDKFLSIAREEGMTRKLDRWVTLKSIRTLMAHNKSGNDTRLTINVTKDTIVDKQFIKWLLGIIKHPTAPKDTFTFQITMDDAIAYPEESIKFIKALKKINCRTSISLFREHEKAESILESIDVDYIKLDREVVKNAKSSKNNLLKIAQKIKEHGKLVIAPRVENAGLISSMWQLDIDYLQGNYMQAPTKEMNYSFSDNE